MHGSSVLIVEDESVIALDLKIQLERLGYVVMAIADSGKRAIALVDEREPHLVLMDVRLRGRIDGIEAAAAIRRWHDVPVIFLTSHSDEETVRRAALTAPYGYLTKPYQIKELRAGIEVALTKARMERQLREADRWFADTLRCVTDAVILTDLEGRVRFLNPAGEKLTGWSVDDALGQEVGEIVRFRAPAGADGAPLAGRHPDDPAAIVRTVLERGRPAPVAYGRELVARGGQGRAVDETAGPVNDESGKRLGAVLVLRDASERVEQEALLRASEERFRGAFDHAPLGMALVSLGGEFIQVNQALCELLGAPAAMIERRGHDSLAVDDEEREHEVRRRHELLSAAQSVVQFERRYRRIDNGHLVWTLVSVSLMREGGQPGCYLYQVHDLTQQKRAAEQLAELAAERMKRAASELANQAKSDFLSRVSHEMRTPLNAVIGFAQLLEARQQTDPAKTGAYAQHIRAAGEHLLQLVTDLLDLNCTTLGTLNLMPQPLQLATVVDETLNLLENLARTHGVDLEATVPADLAVVADAMRLRQVLVNVGSNAIKYNRQGGQVRFVARRLATGRARLTIEDTGIGMTAVQLLQLFQPFERLGLERSKIPGVGLGLVIARGLAIEMGGSLEVTSLPQQGTSVAVELPLAP